MQESETLPQEELKPDTITTEGEMQSQEQVSLDTMPIVVTARAQVKTAQELDEQNSREMSKFVMGEEDELALPSQASLAAPAKKFKINLKSKIKMTAKAQRIVLVSGGALLGIVIVASILTLVFLPKAYKLDYRSVYMKGREASDAMYDVTALESCRGVIRSVDSSFTSKKTYNNYVNKCKDNLAIFNLAVARLAKETTLLNDEELKREWEEFKEVYDRTMPVYEKMLEIYPDWHDFSVNIVELTKDSDWWMTATDQSIDAAYAPIANSESDSLAEWGMKRAGLYKNYVTAYKAYKEAYDMYLNASYSATNKMALREDWQKKSAEADAAYEIFKKYNSDNVISLTEILGADLTSDDYDIEEYMSDLFDALHAKYLETYLQKEGDAAL